MSTNRTILILAILDILIIFSGFPRGWRNIAFILINVVIVAVSLWREHTNNKIIAKEHTGSATFSENISE